MKASFFIVSLFVSSLLLSCSHSGEEKVADSSANSRMPARNYDLYNEKKLVNLNADLLKKYPERQKGNALDYMSRMDSSSILINEPDYEYRGGLHYSYTANGEVSAQWKKDNFKGGPNSCLNQLAGEYLMRLAEKENENLSRVAPFTGSLQQAMSTTVLRTDISWAFQEAVKVAGGNRNLAMQLFDVCGDSHGSMYEPEHCRTEGFCTDVKWGIALKKDKGQRLKGIYDESERSLNRIFSGVAKELKDVDGDDLGKIIERINRSSRNTNSIRCPSDDYSMKRKGEANLAKQLPSKYQRRNPYASDYTLVKKTENNWNDLPLRAALASCSLYQSNASSADISNLKKDMLNSELALFCSYSKPDNQDLGLPKDSKALQQLTVKAFNEWKNNSNYCEKSPNSIVKKSRADLLFDGDNPGCKLLASAKGSLMSDEASPARILRSVRLSKIDRDFQATLFPIIGGQQLPCENADYVPARLRNLRNFTNSKGTSACPKGFSPGKCSKMKKMARGLLWDLDSMNAQLDVGHKFAKKNCTPTGRPYNRIAKEQDACKVLEGGGSRRSSSQGTDR